MARFINAELESDSESEPDSDSNSKAEKDIMLCINNKAKI